MQTSRGSTAPGSRRWSSSPPPSAWPPPSFPNAPLASIGVDHVLIDDGDLAAAVRRIVPGGVDAALELVGTPTLRDTLRATRIHGVVCFTGMLSNQWTIPDFYPIDYIPRGVRLTSYTGGAADLPGSVLQEFLQAVSEGTATVPIGKVYALDDIVQAHTDMEENRVSGGTRRHHLRLNRHWRITVDTALA